MTPGQRYLALQEEIVALARRHGRDPAEISLLAVSKGYSWPQVEASYQVGARDFGESRLQEATVKISAAPQDIRWHLVGTLQRKKVPKAVGMFSLIHSVDTPELAHKIALAAEERDTPQSILLQVNTSGEESKQGLSPDAWRKEVASVLENSFLRVEGLMTMAPLTEDETVIRRCFSQLRDFRDELGLGHLSMGMSQDYRLAIAEGATIIRIGTALFGGP